MRLNWITVGLSNREIDCLKDTAKKEETTVNMIFRRIVREYLRGQK